MSPSETHVQDKFNFNIEVSAGRTLSEEDLQIQVFDHQNKPVFKGHGSQSIRLPRGLYTVRTEFGSQWEDQVVRHADSTTSILVSLPERPSPVPVYGTKTVHEYYSDTSRRISQNMTAAPVGAASNSGLFIFIRAEDQDNYQGDWLFEDIYLLDSKGNRLKAFGPRDGEWNQDFGYFGASFAAQPGLYLLQQKGDVPREMPLYVFETFQTQVFIFFRERALLESATILMNRVENGFNPDDRIADVVDMALRGLQSDSEVLPRNAMNYLLHGKFENPMLGLLGAHYLLRQKEISESLLSMVLFNLNSLIPGSPDVAALALMARKVSGFRQDFGIPEEPPMIHQALEALYTLSGQDDFGDLIAPGSLIESIASRRYIDSAYSSWRPEEKTYRSSRKDGSHIEGIEPWVMAYLRKQKEISDLSKTTINLLTYARRLNLPIKSLEKAWAFLEISDGKNDFYLDD